MMRIFIVTILIALAHTNVFSQSTILLMSGVVIEGENVIIDDEYVGYDFIINEVKDHHQLEKYRVFSVTDKDQKETLLYLQDSTEGRYYSVDEMRIFIKGEQDSKQNFKSPMSIIIPGVIGVANGLVFSYSSQILALPGIFVTTFVTSAMPTKVKAGNPENESLLKEFAFHDGYKRVSKTKKLRNGFIGSFIGTTAGLVTGILLLQ